MPVKALFRSVLIAGAIAVAPLAAVAQQVITKDTTEIDGGFALSAGSTHSVAYTVNPPDKFILSLSFSGTGARSALQRVTYGIQTADHYFEGILGPVNNSSGYGFIEDVLIDGPFSIVYAMSAGSRATADVTYYGVIDAVPVSVPEIGAKGAVSAFILLMGSIAVLAGRRKPSVPALAA